MLAGFAEATAVELHQLIGKHGDEQVAVGANLLVVIDGAETELGLQGTKFGFQVSEHNVGVRIKTLCEKMAEYRN